MALSFSEVLGQRDQVEEEKQEDTDDTLSINVVSIQKSRLYDLIEVLSLVSSQIYRDRSKIGVHDKIQ